jgi:hypothetical protein
MITISATQLRELISGCRRKWAWRYVARRKAPESWSARLGSEVHSVLAALLNGSADTVDQTRATNSGVLRAPLWREAVEIVRSWEDHVLALRPYTKLQWVEREIRDPLIDGVELVGVVDLVTRRDGVDTVWDHKTIAAERYALTPSSLREDIQLGVYARLLPNIRVYPTLACWDYYQTRGEGARRRWVVQTEIAADAMARVMERVLREAEWVREVFANQTEPRDIAVTPDVCRAYGGCPYSALCAARPSLRDLEQIKERQMDAKQEMTVLDKLRARKRAAEAAAASSAAAEVETASRLAAVAAPLQVTLALPRETDTRPQAHEGELVDLGSVSPPRPAAPQAAVSGAAVVAEPVASAPAQDASAEASPKRRGRPPKPAPAPAPEPEPALARKTAGCVICVDCVPVGIPAQSIDDLLTEACAEVAEDSQVEHWQLVPYGGGHARLALAARRRFAESPPRGYIVAASASKVYQAVAAELRQYGALVLGAR